MIRAFEERVRDVRRLVVAARDLSEKQGRIGSGLNTAIARSSGLSPAGVALGFARHLEIDASDAQLGELVARTPEAEEVTVILSANVFTAALRAIAIARAASSRVVVRPSRREPAFARTLLEYADDEAIRLVDEINVAEITRGEIHVYGRDATIDAVHARAGSNIQVRGHGAGFGAAVLSTHADLVAGAHAFARDIVAFDQRGCLSPRIALVIGDVARACSFGAALHAALESIANELPRGTLREDERAEARRYISSIAFAAAAYVGEAHAIGVASAGAPLWIAPAGRHMHIATFPDAGAARASLEPFAPMLVAIGSDDPIFARTIAPSHARVSALGEMQRPPLDGPVDRRRRA